MNKRILLKKIKNEVLSLFIDCEGIILTGSFLKKGFNKNSDVDIILISSTINLNYTEKIEINNIVYEFIYLPINKIEEILHYDITSSKGVIFNMLSSCEIIKDIDGISSKIIEYSKYVYQNKYPFFDEKKKRNLEIKIINYIEDLNSKKNDYFTKFVILNEIISLFIQCYINKLAGFIGNGKNKINTLLLISPEIYINLQKCLKDALEDDNKIEYFVEFIKSKLDISEMKNEYSERNLPLNIESGLIIKLIVPIFNIKNNFYESINEIAKSFKVIDFSISQTQFELVILLDKKTSFLLIISKFMKAFKIYEKNRATIKISNIKLNSTQVDSKVKLTNFILNEIIQKKYPLIILGVELFQKLTSHFLKKHFNKEIKYIYKYWLPNSYDNELEFDFFTLNEIKGQTLIQFEKKYEILIATFLEKEFNFDALINEIYNLYMDFKNSNTFDNSFFCKYISFEENKINREIIFIEDFLAKIYNMLSLRKEKAFFAYFSYKLNQNENE